MKTKVEIYEGRVFIDLTPENEFEETVIENGESMKGYNAEIDFRVGAKYGVKEQHKMVITLTEKK